jgi:hypothetical protein
MVPELVAFATSQGDVFTAEQARSAGYSRREIEQLRQSGHWVALRRGIYARREIVESANRSNRERHRLDIAAALLATAPGCAWASHQSAAVLWELEFLTRPDLTQVRLTRPGLDRSRVPWPPPGAGVAAGRASSCVRCRPADERSQDSDRSGP